MSDMTFKEFCRRIARMCAQYYDCKNCELFKYCEYEDRDTQKLLMRDTDKIESIVQEWAQEHPEQATNPSEEKQATAEQAKTYEQGLEDAWELARKMLYIWFQDENEEISEKYGSSFVFLSNHTPQEAMQKIREWESKQILVGDEVIINGDRGVITSFGTDGDAIHILWTDGIVNSYRRDVKFEKTGRNIADKLNALLEEIGGKQDGEV